jgi:hypothetical protein
MSSQGSDAGMEDPWDPMGIISRYGFVDGRADSTGCNENANGDITDPQVIEYLLKKGYNKTERQLRQESAHLDKDGRPIQDRVEDLGEGKYRRAFAMLSNWIEGNLDIYKVGLAPSRDHSWLTIC